MQSQFMSVHGINYSAFIYLFESENFGKNGK